MTDTGRYQLRAGYKKSSPFDAQFYGDARYRPIASDEVVFLVRLLFRISKMWEAHSGVWVDLRPWASDTRVALVVAGLVSLFFVITVYIKS